MHGPIYTYKKKTLKRSLIAKKFQGITRQAMYVYLNFEVRSCNNYWSGKTIIITYSDSMFLSLGILHTMRMRHI